MYRVKNSYHEILSIKKAYLSYYMVKNLLINFFPKIQDYD